MADRSVSARLRADVTAYIAAMRAARRETRLLYEEMRRGARQAQEDFDRQQQGANDLERALRRLMETERQRAQSQNDQSQEIRRHTEETRRLTEEIRRNTQSHEESTRVQRQSSQSQQQHTQQTQQNTQAQQQNTRATQDNVRGLTANRRTLISLIATAGAAGVAITSAAVATAAFGAIAAGSIVKVVAAQSELAERWTSLTSLQQASALHVRNLARDYQGLARSYEPEALAAFNSLVSTTRGLLPRLGDVVDRTGGDFQVFLNRITGFIDNRIGGELLTWAGQQAPQAFNVLGDSMVLAGDTTLDLLQDIEPLGITLLEMANGTLSAVNALAAMNPAVAQLAISALLLRAPILGLVGGIGALSGRARQFAAANRGASLATRALNVVTAAAPALYVAAGAAALYWVSKAGQATSVSQRLTAALRAEYRAIGNNIVGYQALARDIMPRLNAAVTSLTASQKRANDTGLLATKINDENAAASIKHAGAVLDLEAELERAQTAMRNINTASEQLSERYGITRDEAIRLADAAGVDLSKAIDKSGNLTADAAAKIRQYQYAAELASSPTRMIALALDDAGNEALQMKDRVTALTTAMDAAFNPSLALFNLNTQLREGYRKLAEELVKARGSMSGNSEESIKLRQAFGQQLQTVRDLATATFNKTRSMDAARQAVQGQLPILYALAGRNREARAQVDALARSLGINASQVYISRSAFIAQATAMLGSRTRAEQLWQMYQRLTGATNTGSSSLSTYIARTRTAAEAARQQASRTDFGASRQQVYNSRVREALPVLYALAGNNRAARAQVDALARATGNATGATNVSRAAFLRAAEAMGIGRRRATELWKELNKIPKSKRANVTIYANGKWIPGVNFNPGTTAGRAMGGPIPAEWAIGGGGPTEDDVPMWASVGEHMVTAREVKAVGGHNAMYRLRAAMRRGELRGYATGGEISLSGDPRPTSTVVRAAMTPVRTGFRDTMYSIANAMAAEWKRFANSGGPVVGAARSQLGVPYSWGGGGPGGPSFGIGRGAGTRGFDCSGLTEYAWWQGARKSIGGVTYTQYPNSTHISGPRPGALGFPHMGHVVLASKPGYLIEAPYTGAHVREVPIGRHYEWRWPRAAGYADGGEITPGEGKRLGQRFLGTDNRSVILEAKSLQIAGDPGRLGIPGFAGGGWVNGRGGRDTNLLAATRGEFVVNERAAAASPDLVEGINAGRIGQAMIRPTIPAAPIRVAGGDGAAAGATTVVVHLHNHGAIGSRIEMRDWLTQGLEDLSRSGRAPWPTK